MVSFEDKNNEPKLNFLNEKKTFDELDHRFLFFENKKDRIIENEICKIQNFSDLKKVNFSFDNLAEHTYKMINEHKYLFGSNHGLGNRCYLFEEEDEVKIKTLKNRESVKMFDTKFGLTVCENKGEFGGFLYVVTNNGIKLAGFGSYVFVFEYNDKVYGITTLNHLLSYSCSLHEIRKSGDNFENITLFDSDDLNFAGYYAEDNYLYFYSVSAYNGLYRFDLDTNHLEVIEKYLCAEINVNSILKKDNYIYIYGSYNVIKYNLNNGEKEIYTNLEYEEIGNFWYAHNMKLLDIWDMLLDVKF